MALSALLVVLSIAASRSEIRDDAYLVADLDPRTTGTASANPRMVASLDGVAVFVADQSDGTRGLWRSDGTHDGTWQLSEIPSQATVRAVGRANGRLLLEVAEPTELWATDGTAAGTTRLVHTFGRVGFLGTLEDGSAALALAADHRGGRLWRSDGTLDGTYRVGNVPAGLPAAVAGGVVYFTGWTRRAGWEPWRTDGSAAGTRQVVDLLRGPRASQPRSMAAVGNRVLISAEGPIGSIGLWASTGTAAGTARLSTLGPLATEVSPLWRVDGAGYALFSLGATLWRSDGTAAGTFSLTTGGEGGGAGLAQGQPPLSVGNAAVVFLERERGLGARPWRTDGSVAGTQQLADVCAVGCAPEASAAATADRVYFAASVAGQAQLWGTTGTVGGTRRIASLAGSFSSPGDLTAAGNDLYFTQQEPVTSVRRLWRSRGTRPSTVRLDGPDLASPQEAVRLLAAEQQVFFAASDEAHGSELWASRGTRASTRLVDDVNDRGDALSSSPTGLAALPSGFVVAAGDATGEEALWFLDGTPNHAIRLARVNLHDAFSTTGLCGVAGGSAFYCIQGFDGFLNEVWATDGTVAGSARVWSGDRAPQVATLGDDLLVFAHDLVRSDGTPGGTTPIAALDPAGFYVSVASGERLLYADFYADGEPWNGLWTTDGTSLGTYRLSAEATHPVNLTAFGSDVLFFSPTASGTAQLWISDGLTGASTHPITELTGGVDLSCQVQPPIVATADRAFFTPDWRSLWVTGGAAAEQLLDLGSPCRLLELDAALDGALFWTLAGELWFSDGSASGTTLLASGLPARTRGFVELAGRAYFGTIDGVVVTDGTAAGTRRLAEVLLDQQIDDLGLADDRLVISTGGAIWTSDGTTSGTERRGLFQPLPPTYRPFYTLRDHQVLFHADRPGVGDEVFAFDLP